MKTVGKKWVVETLTRSEVEDLLNSCNGGATGSRNRAIITLIYRTGLRISEALNLRPTDIDSNKLTVVRGKGGKRRVVGLDSWSIAALNAWKPLQPRSKWLFCTLDGNQVSSAYMRNLLRRLKKKCGFIKRIHPHGLRHSFASDAAMDLPLPVLSAAIGHSHISTTERYIHQLNPRVVVEAMAKRS